MIGWVILKWVYSFCWEYRNWKNDFFIFRNLDSKNNYRRKWKRIVVSILGIDILIYLGEKKVRKVFEIGLYLIN